MAAKTFIGFLYVDSRNVKKNYVFERVVIIIKISAWASREEIKFTEILPNKGQPTNPKIIKVRVLSYPVLAFQLAVVELYICIIKRDSLFRAVVIWF
jgi:hypothetical protein